jgi:hypothetical protein
MLLLYRRELIIGAYQMFIKAGSEENNQWIHTKIQNNGIEIPFCLWLDTELGIAECAYGQKIQRGPYQNSFTRFLWTPEQEVHTYTLHNFEVWDTRSNTMIAKV